MKQYHVDVLVCGGGPAGVAAAVHAARRGARTMIIEQMGTFGGLMTNDYVTGIAGYMCGFVQEYVDRLYEKGWCNKYIHDAVDPEKGKFMLEQMLLEANVQIMYFTTLVDARCEDGHVISAICHNKGGLFEVEADLFIDATGDGDLGAYAGAICDSGSNQFGFYNAPSSIAFRLANVNLVKYKEASAAWAKTDAAKGKSSYSYDLFTQAIANKDMPDYVFPGFLAYKVPGTKDEDADVTVDVCHSYNCRNLDPEDVSRQAIEQHREMLMLEEVFRKYFPGYENCRLTGIGSLPGMRETRRVIGDYILSDMDVLVGNKFEDGITIVTDILCQHHPTSRKKGFYAHTHVDKPIEGVYCVPAGACNDWDMHPFMEGRGYEVRNNQETYCEIPYRCLVPKGLDNLLTAGRCISTTWHAQIASRLIAPSFNLGHAAGVAAGMCLDMGILPHDLDGKLVRKELVEAESYPMPLDPGITRRKPKELVLHGEQLRAHY